MRDLIRGSSAKILTGNRVDFGTSGFTVHVDVDSLVEAAEVVLHSTISPSHDSD